MSELTSSPSLNDPASDPTLEKCLALIRFCVAGFLSVWAFDKIINAPKATGTFERYYAELQGLTDLGLTVTSEQVIVGLGIAQLVLIVLFAAGAFRTLTYGAVTLMHAVSTFASWPRYLDPLARPNILFWAAVPVLAAMIALFVLRRRDRFLSFDASREL